MGRSKGRASRRVLARIRHVEALGRVVGGAACGSWAHLAADGCWTGHGQEEDAALGASRAACLVGGCRGAGWSGEDAPGLRQPGTPARTSPPSRSPHAFFRDPVPPPHPPMPKPTLADRSRSRPIAGTSMRPVPGVPDFVLLDVAHQRFMTVAICGCHQPATRQDHRGGHEALAWRPCLSSIAQGPHCNGASKAALVGQAGTPREADVGRGDRLAG